MPDERDDLEKYLNGELDEKQRHALEKRALHDPFLADALAGGEQLAPTEFSHDVFELQQKLQSRSKRKSSVTWRIAAGMAIALGLGAIAYYYSTKPEADQLIAEQKPATIDTQNESKSSVAEVEPTTKPKEPQRTADSERTSPSGNTTTDPIPPESRAVADAPTANQLTAVDPAPAGAVAEAEAPRVVAAAPVEVRSAAGENEKKSIAREETPSQDIARQRKLPVPPATLQAQQITGLVVSAEDGNPLPGVNVMLKGTTEGTVTDAEGRFQLPLLADGTLVFSFIGLQSVEQPMTTAPLLIKMPLDVSSLSEVVVTGYGISAEDATGPYRIAEPQGGRKAFNQYLEETVKYPPAALAKKIEGKVTVQFKVQQTGLLSDFLVIKGIGGGCEEELIRLIQAGPAWTAELNNGKPVIATVRVRYNFRLSDR
jgi:TonB family protein